VAVVALVGSEVRPPADSPDGAEQAVNKASKPATETSMAAFAAMLGKGERLGFMQAS
jgi:hypothetical protein